MSIARRSLLTATTLAAVPLLLRTAGSDDAWAAPPANQSQFDQAVAAFNTASLTNKPTDWDNLGTYFADKVRLWKVNNKGCMKDSRRQIINYMSKKVSGDNELFLPTTTQYWSTDGQLVWGIANWQDNDTGTVTTNPIMYFFHFNSSSMGLIDVMFGSKD
jgi:hypothetical protein